MGHCGMGINIDAASKNPKPKTGLFFPSSQDTSCQLSARMAKVGYFFWGVVATAPSTPSQLHSEA